MDYFKVNKVIFQGLVSCTRLAVSRQFSPRLSTRAANSLGSLTVKISVFCNLFAGRIEYKLIKYYQAQSPN